MATGLIRASLTGDKFATDTIMTRAVEADLDGLFFAFTMANLAGRVLAYARTSEAQAVALLDNLINGLVRERARAAALQLKLDFVPGFGLLPPDIPPGSASRTVSRPVDTYSQFSDVGRVGFESTTGGL